MTREEAIKVLDSIKVKIDIPKAIKSQHQKNEAIDMAIEAINRVEELEELFAEMLEQAKSESKDDDWIPASDPPKENANYIVSLEDSVYPWGRFFNGKWFMISTDGIAREFGEYEVRAWKPLPAPYKESDSE